MAVADSRLPGFFKLPMKARRARVAAISGLDAAELEGVLEGGGLDCASAEQMVENALGVMAMPLALAPNFRVNGRDYLVPMVVEEPSVVAAAAHAAKRARAGGGFWVHVEEALMEAQVAVHEVADVERARRRIAAVGDGLLARANGLLAGLVRRGGGARELIVRDLGEGLVAVHVVVDCCDAMGANILNTVAEELGADIAAACGGRLGIRIVSNYCVRRLARARVRVPLRALGATRGARLAAAMVDAAAFAERDTYRAVTHNKGVMNGIDAVLVATGNDWRAVEAAAHAYAARAGSYRSLSRWRLTPSALEGQLELPLAVGAVGGALRIHRGARLAMRLLAVSGAKELAAVVAAAGLASNLAALRALASEGIQRGHMALHHRGSDTAAAGARRAG